MNRVALRPICDKKKIPALAACVLVSCILASNYLSYKRAPSYGSREVSNVLNLRTANYEIAHPIAIAVFDQDGSGNIGIERLAEILDATTAIKWRCVGAAEVKRGGLSKFDVAIFPGGRGSGQAAALAVEGREAVKEFVRSGGGYVGICAGAFLATTSFEWSLSLVNVGAISGDREIPGVGFRSMAEREPGNVLLELTNDGKRVFGRLDRPLRARYTGGPIFVPSESHRRDDYATLATFRTDLYKVEPQKGTMLGSPAIIAARYGLGRVILFSAHPELSPDLEPLVVRSILSTAKTQSREECN